MKVYLDDVRDTPEGWERAYTYEEAIEFLKTGLVVEISLDNDLGTEKEGRHVALWIEQMVAHTSFPPPKIWVHSANIVAANSIRATIESVERLMQRRGKPYPPSGNGPHYKE